MATFDMRDCSIWSDVVICQASLEIPVKNIKSLEELKLKPSLLEGLREAGIIAPRDIQNFVFPILFGDGYENVLITAPAETGKTTAAIIKALDIALDIRYARGQVLMAYTTRDNAINVYNRARQLAKCCPKLTFHLAIKDEPRKPGEVSEKIIVGTPEKLKDYVLKGKIDSHNIRLVVLDGIDSTFSGNGHRMAVTKMYQHLPNTPRTVLLISVPRDSKMDEFFHSLVKFPVYIDFPHKIHRNFSSTVEHLYLKYSSIMDRISSISKILDHRVNGQCVVVCDSKDSGNDVFKVLTRDTENGIIAYIHGKLKPQIREITLKDFKNGKYKVLITTPMFRKSIEFHCNQHATIVNFDTKASTDCLDHTEYMERASILEKIPGALSINMINDQWNDYATDEYGKKVTLCEIEDFEDFLISTTASKLSLQH